MSDDRIKALLKYDALWFYFGVKIQCEKASIVSMIKKGIKEKYKS